MRRKLLNKLVVILSVLTMLCYLSVFVSPVVFWPIGLINYLIPVLILIQFFLLFFTLFRNRKLAWLPALCLISGYYFIDITVNWPTEAAGDSDFEVLSFNARYFRKRHDYSRFQHETIAWAAEEDSDIKCFQEFSTYPKNEITDVVSKIEARGYFSYAEFLRVPKTSNSPGLAIFSRYPIVNKGLILLNKESVNNCIFADVVIKSDTIRIYNFHLKSMGLNLHRLKDPNQFGEASQETATKLGSASSKRALELDSIINHIGMCPYPYLLVCDFNELPYGNSYYKIRKAASDTFEEVGGGFGFTFNSILFFIRIDHQFFSEGIEAVDLKILKEVRSSDHFPLKGYYKLK